MKRSIKISLLLFVFASISSCTKYEFEEPISGSKSIVSVRENAADADIEDTVGKVSYEESLAIVGRDGTLKID